MSGDVECPLPADEVHVWEASLDEPPEVVEALARTLSGDECDRADRFYFERDRSRFIVGRGLLRLLLSRYVGVQPTELRFAYGTYRKPYLASGGPKFNLSHSGGTALFALSSRAELGIDIELDNPDFAGERIPEHFFSAAEVSRLRSLPQAVQAHAFLECWTRKEAFIKARGDGLSLALDSFSVSLGPAEPAALLHTRWTELEPKQWSLADLSDPEGRFVAALATRSKGWRVVKRRVPQPVENSIQRHQEDR